MTITQSIYKTVVKTFGNTKLVKVSWIRRLNNKLREKLKPEFIITQEGHKIFLDKQDSLHLSIYNNWERENFQLETMKKIVKEGDFVVDVGANIGFYTLILAKLVGDEGKVFAFEPHPMNVSLLKKNIKANNYENVIVIERAISNEKKNMKLYIDNQSIACSSLVCLTDSHDTNIIVEVNTLDNYFKYMKINFMKIDVEGFEGHVIEGSKKIIKNNNVKIMTEICPPALEGSGFGQENYLKLLKEQGFNLYNINEKNKELVLVGVSELMNINPFTKNLLCIKNEINF